MRNFLLAALLLAGVGCATTPVGQVGCRDCGTVRAVDLMHNGSGQTTGAGALVGAVIGGVIGHQFGGGSGRDAATAAGAFIGANHAAARSYSGTRVVEREVLETRCETVREARYEEVLDGYDVTYKYHGRLYHTRTARDPGRTIKVRVSVSAAQWD
jgi:uncharacterized protein YcfJ